MGLKARVKATGEIISLDEKSTVLDTNPYNFNSYEISELEILYENTNFPKDYWQKLEHQYTGMAMNALLLTNNIRNGDLEGMRECNTNAMAIAHALVEKQKEKEER